MTDKDGGPAFPRDGRENPCIVSPQSGMTLRDYFAAKAMQGLLSNPHWNQADMASIGVSLAYSYADAALRERAK